MDSYVKRKSNLSNKKYSHLNDLYCNVLKLTKRKNANCELNPKS